MAKEKYGGNLNSYLYSHSSYMLQELCTGVAMKHRKQACNGNRKDTREELARLKGEKCEVVADEAEGAREERYFSWGQPEPPEFGVYEEE